jgi:hypothetical protein
MDCVEVSSLVTKRTGGENNQLSAEDAGDLLGFDVLTGSSYYMSYCMPCDQWADVSCHVGNTSWKYLLHKFTRSFGALGFLASSEDQSGAGFAIVDTGASLTITP